jgi:hypothetical protein
MRRRYRESERAGRVSAVEALPVSLDSLNAARRELRADVRDLVLDRFTIATRPAASSLDKWLDRLSFNLK